MKEFYKNIFTGSKEEYYNLLRRKVENNEKLMIITANPETINYATKDEEVSDMLLNKKNSIVPDGIAIVKTGRMLGINFKERITGVDIAEKLFEYASNDKKKVYIFGSKQEVLDKMKETITQKYNGLKLVGSTNGYVEDKDKVFEDIKKAKPDIIFVSLGIPLQEKLIYKHINEFKSGIFIGVGGSIDVLSGSKKRAPKIFINTNTEWLYRILKEPKRLKRFWNNNVKFIIKVRKEKIQKNNKS